MRRAHQLLACYRAVAALRSDEQFQEDAAEPAVQAALQEMAVENNLEKWVEHPQELSRCVSTVIEHSKRTGLQAVSCACPQLGVW